MSTRAPDHLNVHATGLVLGDIGVVLRGPSGAGKSLLALQLLDRQTLLGESGFRVVNTTPLPLVCFVDERRSDGQSAKYLSKAMHVVTSEGKSWISMTRIGEGKLPALRACITNYETTEEDLARLIVMLERARLEIA